jgi:hypothetical protein
MGEWITRRLWWDTWTAQPVAVRLGLSGTSGYRMKNGPPSPELDERRNFNTRVSR